MRQEQEQTVKPLVPNPYALFADQPEVIKNLEEAEALLKCVIAGELPFSRVRVFLDQSGQRAVLTSLNPLLDGISPMQALREKVVSEQIARSSARLTIPKRVEIRGTPQYVQTAPGKREETIFERNAFSRTSEVVSERNDIGASTRSKVVHLGNPRVVNISSIGMILQTYPELEIIEIPKSFLLLVGPTIRKLLNERGISLAIGRIKDNPAYDVTPVTQNYQNHKRRFQEVLAVQERKVIFDRMLEHEFLEAEIASLYFGHERISVREIAERLGITWGVCESKLATFYAWSETAQSNKTAVVAAKNLIVRLNRLETAYTKEGRQKLRESYAVGGFLPSESLPPARLENWQKLYKMLLENRENFEQLKAIDPKLAEILFLYYQLQPQQTQQKATTLEELGGKYSVTKERIRQLRNKALDLLGIFDEV